jgi:hypothetical protein
MSTLTRAVLNERRCGVTCKECIHEKVCDALIKSGCPYLDKEIPAEAFCLEFRNTADIVPKSEVEKWKEINEQLHKEMSERILEERKIERKLVAREIFEEIENNYADFLFDGYRNIVVLTEKDFAELKNKYTGENNNDNK